MLLIAAAVIGASRVTVSPRVTCSQTASVAVGRSRAAASSQSSRRAVGFQSESGWLAIGTHTEWSGDAFDRGSCSTRPSSSSDRWSRRRPASSERRSAPYQPTNNTATSRDPRNGGGVDCQQDLEESLGSERVGLILVGAQSSADRLESDSDPGVFGGVLVVEVAGGDGGDGDQLVDRGEAAGDGGIGGAAVLEGAEVGGDDFRVPSTRRWCRPPRWRSRPDRSDRPARCSVATESSRSWTRSSPRVVRNTRSWISIGDLHHFRSVVHTP